MVTLGNLGNLITGDNKMTKWQWGETVEYNWHVWNVTTMINGPEQEQESLEYLNQIDDIREMNNFSLPINYKVGELV